MPVAGVGARLGEPLNRRPKVLLEFGGETLLARHLAILKHCGIEEVVLGVGHGADEIEAALHRLGVAGFARTVYNPDFRDGGITTLWRLREALIADGPVLLMDGDVLYDHRMIERLIRAPAGTCLLMDRDVEPGEEPLKVCIRDGQVVDFRKTPTEPHDYYGEWIGFLRLSPDVAAALGPTTDIFVTSGIRHVIYEEAIRDLLLSRPPGTFRVEDVTGLPWIEIDFPADVRRAEREVLANLAPLPA